MSKKETKINIMVPEVSSLTINEYKDFLAESHRLLKNHSLYLSDNEGPEALELAHLLPHVPETILSIYIGINDVVCNKGLVTPFLPRHAHNNVFAFDPDVYSGKDHIPEGTIDAKYIVNGFLPPNKSWNEDWTYVMIEDPARTYDSLWKEKGYIDMIPAKFEDFTMMSDHKKSSVCTFIDPEAFFHPVNRSRDYLKAARDRGEQLASGFIIPDQLAGETGGLVPVVLRKGEKLYVARADFQPCAHCWSNIHPDNEEHAVVNENSAIPLNLVISKPPVNKKFNKKLIPPAGSADNTTDWFFRAKELFRKPIKEGHIDG
ncbi:MAG: hypothetical protein ABFS28_03560 [Bacteroidota bacterium]